MRRYALESSALSRLLADRSDLLAYARTLGTAEAMRAARADLMATARVYRTPNADHPLVLDIREGVAHVPVVGELTPSADPCGAFSMQGATEYGYILAALSEAVANPLVHEIALDINSPGGYIDGVDAVAQAVRSASADAGKPVTAYVDSMAASAAYWIASQADRIVALSPASEVGSIGVACEEYDDRDQLAAKGIAHRVYTSTDAPDKRPDTATDEGRAKIIAELDALHAVFARRVAEGRGVSLETVASDFGRGGVLTAEAALTVGMLDEVRGSHLARTVSSSSSAGVAGSAASATAAASPQEEVLMDLNLDTLKAEHPDVYGAVLAEGKTIGATDERKRREALLGLKGSNTAGDLAVEQAIKDGMSVAEASPLIAAAIIKGTGGENAPEVTSAKVGATEDREIARLAGLVSGKEGK